MLGWARPLAINMARVAVSARLDSPLALAQSEDRRNLRERRDRTTGHAIPWDMRPNRHRRTGPPIPSFGRERRPEYFVYSMPSHGPGCREFHLNLAVS